MPSPNSELYQLEHDAIIPLFVLDLNPIGQPLIYRFCNWKDRDPNNSDVTFQGQVYTPMPIKADGFEFDGGDSAPTPTISIGNVTSAITILCQTYADLVGAKVTRKRTFAKYLDRGSEPQPLLEYTPDVFYVGRKAQENKLFVTFELRSPTDLGLSTYIPARRVTKNYCQWEYRGSRCGYTGGAVATEKDVPTSNLALDKCGKRVKSCELRFGAFNQLNFSSFPGLAN